MGFTIGILANRLGFAIGRTIFKAVGVMCRVLPFTHGTVLVMATLLSAAAGVATIVLYCNSHKGRHCRLRACSKLCSKLSALPVAPPCYVAPHLSGVLPTVWVARNGGGYRT